MPGLSQQRATEPQFLQVQRPGQVVMADQLTAHIVRGGVGIDSRIREALKDVLGDIHATFKYGHWPQQFIELGQRMAASSVPRLDALPGRTGQRHPPPRIHTVTRQRHARQVEHLAQIGRHQRIVLRQGKQIRITAGHRPACGIEPLMRDPCLKRIGRLPPMKLHRSDCQPTRVRNRKGWRAVMRMVHRHP
ncbi:hypothetical protein D3C71_1333300 [compost metagenome]